MVIGRGKAILHPKDDDDDRDGENAAGAGGSFDAPDVSGVRAAARAE